MTTFTVTEVIPTFYVHCSTQAIYRTSDFLGGFGLDDRLWLGLVLQQAVLDHGFKIIHAGVAFAADAFCGDLGEDVLDEVHPKCS